MLKFGAKKKSVYNKVITFVIMFVMYFVVKMLAQFLLLPGKSMENIPYNLIKFSIGNIQLMYYKKISIF